MGPTAWKTYFAGSLPAVVATALPVGQPPILRHSSMIPGPPARWIAPSTPPPPRNPELAALTMASTCISTILPRRSAMVTPLIVCVDIKISSIFLLQQQAEWLLQEAFDLLQETGSGRAIDSAVVGGKRYFHTIPHCYLAIYHHRSRGDRTDCENGRLGRVNDGGEAIYVKHAQVTEGESAAD